MSEIKSALTAKRLSKAVDGVKHHRALPATAEAIARKSGSRIHLTKAVKPGEHGEDGPPTHRSKPA
jgi:hypothetical protein